MATYQISFFKSLLSSDGHPFRCLQGQLEIHDAKSPSQAAAEAERRFEMLHHVPKWNLRADSVDIAEVHECSTLASKAPAGMPTKKQHSRNHVPSVGGER